MEKKIAWIGRIASFMSVLMYISYIPQIANNLAGMKGSPTQPFVAMINCIFWLLYAALKEKKDWPIIVANAPGILLGAITFITSL